MGADEGIYFNAGIGIETMRAQPKCIFRFEGVGESCGRTEQWHLFVRPSNPVYWHAFAPPDSEYAMDFLSAAEKSDLVEARQLAAEQCRVLGQTALHAWVLETDNGRNIFYGELSEVLAELRKIR